MDKQDPEPKRKFSREYLIGDWRVNPPEISQAQARALLEACKDIVALSAGWDENGSTGPRHPLSWESVGRVAMDYARYALKQVDKETT